MVSTRALLDKDAKSARNRKVNSAHRYFCSLFGKKPNNIQLAYSHSRNSLGFIIFLYRNYYYNIFQPVKWVIYNQNFKNKPTNRLTNSLSLWCQYIMNLIILEKCQHKLVFKSHSPQLQGQNIALLTAKALSFLSSLWPMRNEWICLLSESCHRRPVVRAVISELICHSKMFTGFQPCSLIRDAWSKCDSPATWSCLKSWDCRIFQWSISS